MATFDSVATSVALPEAWVAGLHAFTEELAASWHRDAEGDLTLFEGLSLGRTAAFLLWVDFLVPRYRALAGALAAGGSPRDAEAVAAAPFAGSTDWAAPRLAWGSRHEAAARVFNLLAPAGGPSVVCADYPSLRPALLELSRLVPRLDLLGLPAWALSALPGRGRVLWEPRRPRALPAGAAAMLERSRARWERRKRDPAFRASWAWRGATLWPLAEKRLDDWFARELPPLAWAALALRERWTREPRSPALIATDADPYQNLVAQVAASAGAPSWMVQHGLPFAYGLRHEERATSHFAVWGPRERELYAAGDRGASRSYLVAGSPTLGSRRALPPPRPGPLRKALALSSPVVRCDLRGRDEDPSRHAVAVCRALTRRGFNTVFKLHPSESLPWYRNALGPLASAVRLEKGRPVRELVAESDFVVGPFSTVLLEAIADGRPVLCVNLGAAKYPPPFDGHGGLPLLRTEDELGQALDEARRDPAPLRAACAAAAGSILAGFAGPLDGGAARRLAEAVADQ